MAEDLEKIYMGTVPSNTKRFICTECGEYVSFVRRYKHKSYFRHCNRNETTKQCDLRSQALQSSSLYERVGLPLYIKKCNNNKFELYLGFYSLDETVMDIAQKDKFKVYINALNEDKNLTITHFINDINFSISLTTLKRIDYVSQKYKLKYSSNAAEKLLSIRWGNEIEGILSDGALFTYCETGGRKIRINDEITTDTDYFYLCKRRSILDRYGGIKYEYCGEISLRSSFISIVYYVYKINFSAHNDEQFNKLYFFCRDNLKVSLMYKPSKLVPMWPPAIKKDNYISFLNYEKEALFLLNSDEVNTRVFIHRNNLINELKGEEIENNMYLMKVPITTKEIIAVNINEKYNSDFIFVTHYKDNIKTFNNFIDIKDIDDKVIDRGIHSKLPAKRIVKITAKSKCDVIHLKNNQIYQNHQIKDYKGTIINNIDYGDEIIAIDGIENILLLKYIKEYLHNEYNFNDELVYLSICKMGKPFMTPPIWLKKLLLLLSKNHRTYGLVRDFIVTNKMPVSANRILKDLYKTMKAGVDCGQ